MVSLGYPKTHCHRLVCLRKELIDAFIELVIIIHYHYTTLNYYTFVAFI